MSAAARLCSRMILSIEVIAVMLPFDAGAGLKPTRRISQREPRSAVSAGSDQSSTNELKNAP